MVQELRDIIEKEMQKVYKEQGIIVTTITMEEFIKGKKILIGGTNE